jgi:hypothetical protein
MMGKITKCDATKVEKNLMLCLVIWVEVMFIFSDS